jgi:CxxC motif-containing protein (DUF1111 family)
MCIQTFAQVTTADVTRQAFGQPVGGLSPEQRQQFFTGNSFFNDNWVIAPSSTTGRDGLGPLFNMRSCSSCHMRDGRGELPEEGEALRTALVRLSIPGKSPEGGVVPEPTYGDQLQGLAVPKATAEGDAIVRFEKVVKKFADGTSIELRKPVISFRALGYGPMNKDTMTSLRVAPANHGVGLLESIPEAGILAKADPDDKDGDGISGRANRVWDATAKTTRLGRFGWKANQPDVRQQVAGAFNGDIGITTAIFPKDTGSPAQEQKLSGLPNGGAPEVDAHKFNAVVLYSQALAVPEKRNQHDPIVKRGAELFTSANCSACHTPEWTTGTHTEVPQLSDQTIHPYTDLLLHDMGPELADGRPDFDATGTEWRTPPLWGMGLNKTVNGRVNFLHDGRARTVMEAIMWHGGEAEASRNAVQKMNASDRAALVAFLNSI